MMNFFTTGTGNNITWWYVGEVNCSVCGAPIDQTIAAVVFHYKKNGGHEHDVTHVACGNKIKKKLGVVQQDIFQVLLSGVRPPMGIPRFPQPKNMIPLKGEITVFDAEKIVSEVETDKAFRSKTFPSIEGARVGDPIAIEKIKDIDEGRQKVLDSNHKSFFANLKNDGRRAIEARNKGLLE